jgi:ABC-2 type transport system ATP-binding protein
MTSNIIEVHDLVKQYKDVTALNSLSLLVPSGSICGFLGRNGAGKTTTMKILMGMAHPTSGTALVFGEPADREMSSVRIRQRVGFISEWKDLYPFMTVGGIIKFTKSFYPKWDAALETKYVRDFGLRLNQKVSAISKGTRTKLTILLAVCRGAELLILDEPTDGLDPAMIEDVLQVLVAYTASKGATIFFSSHQLTEVEQIADRICIIDQGRAVVEGALDDIKANYRRVHATFDREAPELEAVTVAADRVDRNGRTLSILTHHDVDTVVNRARSLSATSVEVQPVTLKELFLETVREK